MDLTRWGATAAIRRHVLFAEAQALVGTKRRRWSWEMGRMGRGG